MHHQRVQTKTIVSGPASVDKAENGYAVIRFLPEPKGEDLPWVRVFSHGFQGPAENGTSKTH